MDLEITVRLADMLEVMGDLARAEAEARIARGERDEWIALHDTRCQERDDACREVCRLGGLADDIAVERDYIARLHGGQSRTIGQLQDELAARDQALAEAMSEVEHLRGQLADVWQAKRVRTGVTVFWLAE